MVDARRSRADADAVEGESDEDIKKASLCDDPLERRPPAGDRDVTSKPVESTCIESVMTGTGRFGGYDSRCCGGWSCCSCCQFAVAGSYPVACEDDIGYMLAGAEARSGERDGGGCSTVFDELSGGAKMPLPGGDVGGSRPFGEEAWLVCNGA